MSERLTIGFPLYHIDCEELVVKLRAKKRITRVKRLRALGIPIRGTGRDQYVSVIDVIEAFDRLDKQEADAAPAERYKGKSDLSKSIENKWE